MVLFGWLVCCFLTRERDLQRRYPSVRSCHKNPVYRKIWQGYVNGSPFILATTIKDVGNAMITHQAPIPETTATGSISCPLFSLVFCFFLSFCLPRFPLLGQTKTRKAKSESSQDIEIYHQPLSSPSEEIDGVFQTPPPISLER